MEFVLLENALINFPYRPVTMYSGAKMITRPSATQEAHFIPSVKPDGTDNTQLKDEFISCIMENQIVLKDVKDKPTWEFKITISLPNPTWKPIPGRKRDATDAEANNELSCSVKLSPIDTDPGCFLRILHTAFNEHGHSNEDITFNISVELFGLDRPSLNWPLINLTAKGFEKGEFGKGQLDCRTLVSERTLASWKSGREFSGIFTISALLNPSGLSSLNRMTLLPTKRFEYQENLLQMEICTDLNIIVGLPPNQTTIKCHRAFLAGASTVFRSMFENDFREARENKIEMEGISEKGVRALLAYVYYRDTKAVYESSDIAFEVLEAAERYNIKYLRDALAEIFLSSSALWFGMDVVLSLFMFSKLLCPELKIEDFHQQDEDEETDSEEDFDYFNNYADCTNDDEKCWKELKIKALKVLKWYNDTMPQTLLESAKYQELFSQNPKLASEVSSAFLRMK